MDLRCSAAAPSAPEHHGCTGSESTRCQVPTCTTPTWDPCAPKTHGSPTVSYTHLTLPTICSV
eukprot:5760996-Prorocentrum_lima.AAC.1